VRKIGKYEIVRTLSSSRPPRLFEARDLGLGRRVMLLVPSVLRAPAESVRAFLRGTRATTSLTHPRVAQVYELGVESGLPYIVMALVEGTGLDALAGAGPSPSAEWKLHVVDQVCEAIAHAHGQGVLHLDVRPENARVTTSGEVKVLGFGAAPLRSAGFDGKAKGVDDVLYLAPEQIAGDRVDHRADVFSVGALAYWLLSGRPPFSGGSPQEVLERIRDRRPDPALLPQTEYSPRLETVVMTALAPDPADRYQHVEEMRKALDDLVQNSVDAFFDRMLQAEGSPRPPDDGKPDKVEVLYGMALTQAAEGRLEEASKLAKAIRLLAPDDPRNQEMALYLLVEAETAVKAALASSPPGPRAGALRRYLERLRAAHGAAGRAPRRPRAGGTSISGREVRSL
jgi:serine/threonine protein kinase